MPWLRPLGVWLGLGDLPPFLLPQTVLLAIAVLDSNREEHLHHTVWLRGTHLSEGGPLPVRLVTRLLVDGCQRLPAASGSGGMDASCLQPEAVLSCCCGLAFGSCTPRLFYVACARSAAGCLLMCGGFRAALQSRVAYRIWCMGAGGLRLVVLVGSGVVSSEQWEQEPGEGLRPSPLFCTNKGVQQGPVCRGTAYDWCPSIPRQLLPHRCETLGAVCARTAGGLWTDGCLVVPASL